MARGALAAVTITYGGVPIAEENVPVCTAVTCPTAATGPISIKYSKSIPAFIPPGAYSIQLDAKDKAGRTMADFALATS